MKRSSDSNTIITNGFVRGAAPFSHGRRTFSGRFYNRARQQTSGRGVVGGDAPQDR
jgi:hypothetical protein